MHLKRIISRFALTKAKWLTRALAASAEAFLHHSFGERYTLSLVSGLLVVVLWTMVASLIPRPHTINLMPLITAALLVRLFAHLLSVWRRRRACVHVESYSSGSPWGFWSILRLPAGVIRVLLEPLLCFAAGLPLKDSDPLCSLWLCMAGLALMFKTMTESRRARNQVLDVLDARLGTRDVHAAVNRQMRSGPQAAHTTVTPTPSPGTMPPPRSLPVLFQNLDPALQRLTQENAPVATRTAVAPQSEVRVLRQSAPTQIHVQPAQVSRAAFQSRAAPAIQRVVLLRTRPAPVAAPSAAPIVSPSGMRVTNSPPNTAASESNQAMTQANRPAIPKTSEGRNVEVPKSTGLERKSQREPLDFQHGLEEHQSISDRIRIEAQSLGFVVEAGAKSGAQSKPTADLTLTKGSIVLAVQVAITTTGAAEFENVKKCFASGFDRIAIVSSKAEQLKVIAAAVHSTMGLEQAMKISYFTPDEFIAELHRLASTVNKSTPPT